VRWEVEISASQWKLLGYTRGTHLAQLALLIELNPMFYAQLTSSASSQVSQANLLKSINLQ